MSDWSEQGDAGEDGKRYLRVIDYKTGHMGLSYEDLYHGLKLQLPLYLAAAAAADALSAPDEAVIPAGMYYLPVKEPSLSEGVSAEDVERKLLDALRLQGITLKETEIIRISAGSAVGIAEGKQTPTKVAARDELEGILKHAVERSKQTAEEILSGEIKASPFWRRREVYACRFCDYGALCRFDTALDGCAYRGIGKMKSGEFYERVKADGMDG